MRVIFSRATQLSCLLKKDFKTSTFQSLTIQKTEAFRSEWLKKNVDNSFATYTLGSKEFSWDNHHILFFDRCDLNRLPELHHHFFEKQLKQDVSYLGNFYPHEIKVDGRCYPTCEHYYQAAKFCPDSDVFNNIITAKTPKEAKILGRLGQNPDLGDDQKMACRMKRALFAKFLDSNGNANEFGRSLMATGNVLIAEGNLRFRKGQNISDSRWGMVFNFENMPEQATMTGQNLLGKLLMELRSHLIQLQYFELSCKRKT